MPSDKTDVIAAVFKGFKWTAGGRFIGQLISWITTFIVIRHLTPNDYGYHAMISVFTSFLLLFSTIGIEEAIIQKEKTTLQDIRCIFGLLLGVNITICICYSALSPVIAHYYQEHDLIPLICVNSLLFLIIPFRSIPFALLGKQLRYRERAISGLIANLGQSLLAVLMAFYGFGVWTLIWAQLASMAISAIGLNYYCKWLCFPSFESKTVLPYLQFGKTVFLSNICLLAAGKLDFFIGGKFLGPEAIGSYSVAKRLAVLPKEKIIPILNQIALPAYSQIKKDSCNSTSWYFIKVIRIASIFLFPLFYGMLSTADLLLPVLVGNKWNNSIMLLQIISICMPFLSLQTLYYPILYATGNERTVLKNNTIMFAILVPAIVIGVVYGVVGICVASVIAYPISFLVSTLKTSKALNIDKRKIFSAIKPSVISSLIMVLAIFAFKQTQFMVTPLPTAILSVVLGGIVYITVLFLFFRDSLIEAYQTITHKR